MSDAIIALVPQYGLFLLFGVVFTASLAVPLPASMLVLTAGSFAAAGEMELNSVVFVTFAAFLVGGQVAFGIAKSVGPRLLGRLRGSRRMGPILEKSERLLKEKGISAVFLSHTIISPTCPYVCYLSGAGGVSWRQFTLAAVPGVLVWTLAYTGLGYVFASQLELVVETLSHFFGFVLAGAAGLGCFVLLRSRWKAMHAESDA